MNMASLLRAGLIVTLLGNTAVALPRGYSANARDYLESNRDLSHWSCGIYSEARERDVRVSSSLLTMDIRKVMGYVAYDVAPWATVYVTAGGARTELGTDEGKGHTDFGAGVKFNLFDHEIMDPTLFEDRLRINAGLQYSLSQATWRGRDLDYQELSGSLTLSVLNDIEANTLFAPKTIALFAGIVFSDLMGGDINEDGKAGYTAGLEMFWTERTTIEMKVEGFDEASFMGGFHVRL